MLSDLIMELLECEHDPAEREKVYRKIEKAGVDRRTADIMAGEYRKGWLEDQEKAKEELEEKERQEQRTEEIPDRSRPDRRQMGLIIL